MDCRGFLQSLGYARSRRDSEDSEQESSFIMMIKQAEAETRAVKTPENINTNTFVGAQDMSQTMDEVMSKTLKRRKKVWKS